MLMQCSENKNNASSGFACGAVLLIGVTTYFCLLKYTKGFKLAGFVDYNKQ